MLVIIAPSTSTIFMHRGKGRNCIRVNIIKRIRSDKKCSRSGSSNWNSIFYMGIGFRWSDFSRVASGGSQQFYWRFASPQEESRDNRNKTKNHGCEENSTINRVCRDDQVVRIIL